MYASALISARDLCRQRSVERDTTLNVTYLGLHLQTIPIERMVVLFHQVGSGYMALLRPACVCPVLSCPALSCLVLPCPALPTYSSSQPAPAFMLMPRCIVVCVCVCGRE